MPRQVTAAQKHKMMSTLMASQGGRQKIAAMMQEPLRTLRDYQAIGRRAFFIDELPDGALPVYDTDVDTPSYVVGEEGDSVQTVVKTGRLMIPTFEIASLPKIPFTQVKERRFDIVRRIKQKARDELFRKEDQKIFSAISVATAANTVNDVVTVTKANFDMGVMADAFARVERHGLRVDKIFMNATQYPMFRKAGRDYVDFETQRELLRTGLIGTVYGAQVYMSPEIAADEVYLITEPEYFGTIPVRIDLTVLPADQPAERSFGWSIFEALGIGIHNSDLGAQQIKIT